MLTARRQNTRRKTINLITKISLRDRRRNVRTATYYAVIVQRPETNGDVLLNLARVHRQLQNQAAADVKQDAT